MCGAGVVFLLTWLILAVTKQRTFVGVERIWFRCLTAAFYAGLSIIICGVIAALIQDVVRTAKGAL
jgi:hypothetical protein